VVEADSGRALGDVSVRIEEEQGGARFMNMATTDSSGRFAFEDLEPSRYRVSFEKPAYQIESRELTGRRGRPRRARRAEARRGHHARSAGRHLRDAAARADGARRGRRRQPGVLGQRFARQRRAAARCPSLKPGVYELRAESSGYAPVRLPSVQVPSRTISLLLTPGGSLEIQAGPATLALPQAAGRLIGADQRVYMWSSFTSDGAIRLTSPVRRFENVAPGAYSLQVDGGVQREVAITEGGRAVVSLP
jgi:hypothetical protein